MDKIKQMDILLRCYGEEKTIKIVRFLELHTQEINGFKEQKDWLEYRALLAFMKNDLDILII